MSLTSTIQNSAKQTEQRVTDILNYAEALKPRDYSLERLIRYAGQQAATVCELVDILPDIEQDPGPPPEEAGDE